MVLPRLTVDISAINAGYPLHPPSVGRMLPVEIFNLLLGESSEFSVDISLVSLLVIVDLPEVKSDAENKDCSRRRQIETVADGVIWSIER